MFFWAPVRKFQKTSTSVTKQNRFIKKKNKKKASKKRYSMSFRSSHPKMLCKKGVLKNFTCLFAYY